MLAMNKNYRISEFAQRIGRSVSTVRRWEAEGKLTSKRYPSGQRYFDESDVRQLMRGGVEKRLTVVYCRVSSTGQKDELASQITAMELYCRGAGIAVDDWIQEVSSGMNFKRKKFTALLEKIMRGEIAHLIIAHKDRLMRFGFGLFEQIAQENGCQLEVVNQESLSPQQEMVEDLTSIVHTFSCRLHGIRKYQNQIKDDFPEYPLNQPESCE